MTQERTARGASAHQGERSRTAGTAAGWSGSDAVVADARLRTLAENAADFAALMDVDGRFTWVASSVTASLGWAPCELAGRTIFDLLHPDDLAEALRQADRAQADRRATEIPELRIRTKAGAYRWMSGRAMTVRGAGGVPGGAAQGGIIALRDVDELIRTREALQAREGMFAAAFEENPETISVLRPVLDEAGAFVDAEVLYENRIARERYFEGLPLEALVGTRLFARWPQYRDLLFTTFESVVASGAPVHEELHGMRADGEFWSETWAFPFAGGFVHLGRDATEARRALQAAQASEERFHSLVEELDAIVSLVDVATGETFVSPQCLAILGFTPEQMARPGFWRSRVVDDDLERACRIWDNDRDLDAYEIEYRMRRADEEVVWIEERMRAALGPDGEHVRWYGIAIDVTGRHRLEEVVRSAVATEQRLGHMVQLARDIVLLIDGTGRVVEANDAALQAYGYDRDEIRRLTIADLRAPETLPLMEDQLAAAARPEGILFETVHVRSDGTTFPVEVSSHVVEIDGALLHQSIVRDITERRELEARLRQAERMEVVGKLAGGIAHDFNNLLAAIRGYGELTRAELPPDSPALPDVDEILVAVDRATALTRQLLAFSRRQVLSPEVVDPALVIDRLLPMVRRLLGGSIELLTLHDADRGRVRVDPGQLEQVIVNLAVNARDAMPDGGRLTVATRSVVLSAEGDDAVTIHPAGPYVRITVSDDGMGMDAATVARAFEPFFTTKPTGEGTGMGLATVHGIVEQSGGRIAVDSAPGEGTTFTIDLPRVDEPEAVSAVATTTAPGGTETILLVEDEEAVRTALARMLGSLGYTVLMSDSGTHALDLAAAVTMSLDILVSDIRMPGIQGPELARRMRTVHAGLPVLLITGYASDLVAGTLDATASVHVLSKPFDLATLARAVRATLDAPR